MSIQGNNISFKFNQIIFTQSLTAQRLINNPKQIQFQFLFIQSDFIFLILNNFTL
ncbi:hypothetical protein pb186bvf_006193 [Paramecium bursaria]